ncbi:inositol monophosphatase family protein [Ollibium composti]|jgi:myo-inositol-1(or 4)-monophosphatase|uniref:Inositol monophosphatase n=1 Tax=Ollibium composti TaxID=2675109 RepID=A0ABY2Q1V4_9HYPH|nr:inositol monophosphatase [Mesorhizobium composti]THF54427.1 inositol monophosphatase [Mesorhizobium composti]
MTSLPQSERLLAVAKMAAHSVEDQLRTAFRSVMAFDTKRDFHDIVTEHDRASEERIASVIFREVPDSAMVGEEGGRRGSGNVVWYVDPIDGTSNFARGIAYWCVSIAAAVDDEIVAGVVFDPMAGNLFSASLGGAWLNGRPLAAQAFAEERQATLLTSFPNARNINDLGAMVYGCQAELLRAFQVTRNLGSGALNLAHIAAGWSDATLGLSTNPWDVAAGILILRQAGGRYCGFDGGIESEPTHLASDYFATGGGADYPTLEQVARTLSAQTATRHRHTAGART